jgi:hypothetical protein
MTLSQAALTIVAMLLRVRLPIGPSMRIVSAGEREREAASVSYERAQCFRHSEGHACPPSRHLRSNVRHFEREQFNVTGLEAFARILDPSPTSKPGGSSGLDCEKARRHFCMNLI